MIYMTALDWAKENNYQEIVDLLLANKQIKD